MTGAVVGGVGALVGFGILWGYLVSLNRRLTRALGELAATATAEAPPAVTVTTLETSDGTS